MVELVALGTIGTTVLVATVSEVILTKNGKHIESDLIHKVTHSVLGAGALGFFFYTTYQLIKMFIWGF